MDVRVERQDWLTGIADLAPASVDLVYADPPFNTGTTQIGRAGVYQDSWPSIDHWLAWLRERLVATLPALKDTASILLHLDWRTSHRARCLLDDLLGPDRFVNHLVWSYGLGGSSPRRFARKHDDILFYCLHPDRYWFDPPRVEATSARLRGQTKKATDVLRIPGESGRSSTDVQAGRGSDDPRRSTPSVVLAEPRPTPPPHAGEGQLADGASETDVLDIASINNMARERTGYPTQKPLALLDLLVRSCCPPGGVVLDPCCGSGTTLEAAVRAGRRAVGFDISAGAVALSRRRLGLDALEADGTGSPVVPVSPGVSGPYDAITRCPAD